MRGLLLLAAASHTRPPSTDPPGKRGHGNLGDDEAGNLAVEPDQSAPKEEKCDEYERKEKRGLPSRRRLP